MITSSLRVSHLGYAILRTIEKLKNANYSRRRIAMRSVALLHCIVNSSEKFNFILFFFFFDVFFPQMHHLRDRFIAKDIAYANIIYIQLKNTLSKRLLKFCGKIKSYEDKISI